MMSSGKNALGFQTRPTSVEHYNEGDCKHGVDSQRNGQCHHVDPLKADIIQACRIAALLEG